jgi:hypothetical protein
MFAPNTLAYLTLLKIFCRALPQNVLNESSSIKVHLHVRFFSIVVAFFLQYLPNFNQGTLTEGMAQYS